MDDGKNNKVHNNIFGSEHPLRLWALLLFVYAVLSFLYLSYSFDRYERIASSEAIMLGQSLETMFHPEHLKELKGSLEDIGTPEYEMAKQNLRRLKETTNPIHAAYLLRKTNDRLVILMDSELPVSPEYTPPGEVYEEADLEYFEPFETGETVLTDITVDRWGKWRSVLVPIKHPDANEAIAVFGIDYDAAEWDTRLWRQMIPDFIITLAVLLLFMAFIRARMRQAQLKNLSRQLAYDEALYRGIFEQAPIGITISSDKELTYQDKFNRKSVNPMFEQIVGRSAEELSKFTWSELTHPDDVRPDLELFEKFLNREIPGYTMEKRYLKPDGAVVWANMRIAPLSGLPAEDFSHMCLVEDISKRKVAEEMLAKSEQSKRVLIDNLPGLAYRCKFDTDGTMLFVSKGCLDLTGYAPEQFIGNRNLAFNDIINPEHRERLWEEWQRTIPNRLPYKLEYEITTAQGDKKWVIEIGEGLYNEDGTVDALEGIILDITDRKGFEDKLRYFGEHDPWTDLYNRRYLIEILEGDISLDKDVKRALISVNLSTIHSLNLTYGFAYSLALVKRIADELSALSSPDRILFHTHEYRFVYYVKGYMGFEELKNFAERVAETVSLNLKAEHVNGGIGVIEINRDNKDDIETLLRNLLIISERAIYSEHDHDIYYLNEEIENQITREEIIARELVQIAEGENTERMFLHFQPILGIDENRINGFEALARLNSDKLGMISPMEFIPIAERTKLIIPLGDLIIGKAIRFLKKLNEIGKKDISVSVNISAIQLLRPDFGEKLLKVIKDADVDPRNVEIEVTESVFAANFEDINEILGNLKDSGISIAIDDFGTGYSSLAREIEINASCLKIDKYFIDKLLEIEPQKTLVSDIISMGHKLGYYIVAEGVEHGSQLDYLRENGCDKAQGYYISKPLEEDKVIELVKGEPDK